MARTDSVITHCDALISEANRQRNEGLISEEERREILELLAKVDEAFAE